jgi:hypothetical protein
MIRFIRDAIASVLRLDQAIFKTTVRTRNRFPPAIFSKPDRRENAKFNKKIFCLSDTFSRLVNKQCRLEKVPILELTSKHHKLDLIVKHHDGFQ